MAQNRKFLYVNADFEIQEEVLSVTTSAGVGDAGKLATLDAAGKWDISLIPDAVFNDRDWKESVRASTTAALPAVTYANGSGGVGATLTADANGALPAQDGVTLVVGNRLLVKDQAAGLQNGIYVVTQLGDGSNPFILTRATDADQATEIDAGACVAIEEGTAFGDKYAIQTANNPITIGTTALVFTVQNTTNLSAGDGIDITGNVISVDLAASDSGLTFISADLSIFWADVSVVNDLNGTNDKKPIAAEDLYLHGANQGAKVIGVQVTSPLSPFTASNRLQTVLEDLASAISSDGVTFVADEALSKGDLLYVSANNNVSKIPVSGAESENYAIGLAYANAADTANVIVIGSNEVVTGVLTSLSPTAGDKVYWDGSALTLTAPSGAGAMVWQVGVAKNADDLHTNIVRIKRNA